MNDTTVHEHLSSTAVIEASRVQSQMLQAGRAYLCSLGYVECLPPVVGPATDPGIRGAGRGAVAFYGHEYQVMSSVILYKQAALLAHDKIFFVAPNLRLETPDRCDTGRHLAEFHQLDVEAAGFTGEEAMELLEGLVIAMLQVVPKAASRMAANGADGAAVDLSRLLNGGWRRVPFPEIAAAWPSRSSDDPELPEAAERAWSETAKEPFFVTGFPAGSRGFYDLPVSESALSSFDLIMPRGYGEVSSGAARRFEYDDLFTSIVSQGEDPGEYSWYLDLAKKGLLRPSSGFGLGLERLTRAVCGLGHIKEAALFPKLPGVPGP